MFFIASSNCLARSGVTSTLSFSFCFLVLAALRLACSAFSLISSCSAFCPFFFSSARCLARLNSVTGPNIAGPSLTVSFLLFFSCGPSYTSTNCCIRARATFFLLLLKEPGIRSLAETFTPSTLPIRAISNLRALVSV